MHTCITIDQALLSKNPIIDVRSEKEFTKAHILNAINVPLLNNSEREAIGIKYRHNGKKAAIELGYKLVSPRFPEIKEQLLAASINNKIIIHCWRGGKRSEISCDLAQELGLDLCYIEGGYRSYRHCCHNLFCAEQKLCTISGKTGCGKTELLYLLKEKGYQIIDLEGLANHKGSSFGGLGKTAQPTQEMFENTLAMEWKKLDPCKVTFIENESRMIGRIYIPENIFLQIKKAEILSVELPISIREERIFSEYAHFATEDLIVCASKLKKRLGGLRLQKITTSLEEKNTIWINILLDYYDTCYLHHREKHNKKIKDFIVANSVGEICQKVIQSVLS